MARFFHDEDYYYDRGMRENPPAIRALYLGAGVTVGMNPFNLSNT